MNIFAPHRSARKCARSLDDIRLRKMILETAQMLCTAVNLKAGEQVTPYKNSHATNPLVTWAQDRVNWSWLWDLGMELGREYHHRFTAAHASYLVIQALPPIAERYGIIYKENAMPERWQNSASHQALGLSFRHMLNVQKAYRKYMRERWRLQSITPRPRSKKIVPPVWTNRGEPKWR